MKKIYLGVGAAGMLAAGLWILSANPAVPGRGLANVPSGETPAAAARAPASAAVRVLTAEPALADRPLSEEEKDSVKTYLRLLAEYRSISSAQELAQQLKAAKLNPVIARDANKDTGELAMVRTENALPGTRYFHAQVFENGKGGSHAQHLSFEVRPGKDSMEVATALIKQSFRELGTPLLQKEDYVMWRNREGRIVSARRLDAEALRDNYFNAHSPEDIGTVWITSEDDPEEGDEA